MSFRDKKVLALIPARGGSKGVARKNIRLVLGKPLVSHTVDAAINSKIIDQVFLSSDDKEIQNFGESMGVNIHYRSDGAALDTSTAIDVVNDFIRFLPDEEIQADPFIVYLQPTSPLRKASHIDEAFSKLLSSVGNSCISVYELRNSPFKSFVLDEANGCLETLFDESLTNSNRQSLRKAYYPNGAIYIFLLSDFIKTGKFPSAGSIPYQMKEYESIDIDVEEDILEVEKLWPSN